ncbi:phosphatidylserine decarboxylase [Basidiobolus meristosporus CBS 931.73]|uniref:Phosphatidylserine decarboxylase proenzyme 1, mitochondrial n=1 Tax=Basidiobolus meristosporus CBS 931.73 TaxID=1314790 RepID=A0A1Y1YZL9_9FUNG|nr:phosphatidylserine decarboxylase [Basidiobolus meristosporus CBS 931.73]|eukprot:ORY03386.1 phosphatidylserine decarboxylase [Basidiobolus meristosporus CBS 931.73]
MLRYSTRSPLLRAFKSHSVLTPSRKFHYTASRYGASQNFATLRKKIKDTPIEWAPIPVGLGLAYIGFQHYTHVREREAQKQAEIGEHRAPVVVGPWQVHVFGALPLKALSRLFGSFNGVTLPVWLREPGYKFYSWVFGCNLDEMENPDLKSYPNLGDFFYRTLKPGARPIEEGIMVSPSDGKVLHFGVVEGRVVEQIKGFTYNLDAFIGNGNGQSNEWINNAHVSNIADEEEFANVNGISYSLDKLLGENGEVALQSDKSEQYHIPPLKEGNELFFCVIYLAPGDYHRFHSPTNWVVKNRRHFAGELFSVSPYMVKLLSNLFVLNERVVLMGQWRHGFFAMAPVGATNVGSIKINFDKELRTNQKEVIPQGTYTQVSYESYSNRLGGYPLRAGDEVGGFRLGSTIVLVFEAPKNFKFNLKPDQVVRVGQKIGEIVEN